MYVFGTQKAHIMAHEPFGISFEHVGASQIHKISYTSFLEVLLKNYVMNALQ